MKVCDRMKMQRNGKGSGIMQKGDFYGKENGRGVRNKGSDECGGCGSCGSFVVFRGESEGDETVS